MLWTVFRHHFRQLVVHVFLNSGCGFFCFWGFFTDDFGLDRPHCREGLRDTL